jgi:LDH2 family malate/lactate/ureidoglycolate dehydrogenase
MPGEIEERTKAKRLNDGIEIDTTTWGQLVETARSVGVAAEELAKN